MAGITGYFAVATTPLLLAVMAAAQSLPLEAVEQRVTDISELDLSLRQVQTGLLQPNNFKELYRSPVDDRFARISGGLYAVFPRSVYAAKKDKQKRTVVYPVVPAGTIFYIGPPPGWTLSTALDEAASRQEPDPSRIEGRLDLRITPGLMGAALTAGPQAQQQQVHRYSGNNTQPATVPRMVLDG